MALYSENSSTTDSSASTAQRDASYGGSSSSRSSTPASRDMAHALAAAASYSPAAPSYSDTPSYSTPPSHSSDMAHSVAPAYSNPSQSSYSDRSGYSGGSMAPSASGTLANSQGSQNPSSQGSQSTSQPSMGLGAAIRAGMGSDAPSYAPQLTTAPAMMGSMTPAPNNPFNHRGPPQGFMSPSQQYQDRMTVDNGSMLNKFTGNKFGLGPSITTANEIAKTTNGELYNSQQTPTNLAGIQQTMLNRLALQNENSKAYHGSPTGLLKYYDANGYDQPRVMANGVPPEGNDQYRGATFGSPGLLRTSTSLYNQLNGTGPKLPAAVQNATNYVAKDAKFAKWEKNTPLTYFGPNRYSNPDEGREQSVVAALNTKVGAGSQYNLPPGVQVASSPPPQPNPNRVQVSDVPKIPMDPRYGSAAPSASDGSAPVSPASQYPQYRSPPGSLDTRVAENSPAVAPSYPMPPVPGEQGLPQGPPNAQPPGNSNLPAPQFMAPSPPTYSGPHSMPIGQPPVQVATNTPTYSGPHPVTIAPGTPPAQVAATIASVPALAKVAATNPGLIQKLVASFQGGTPQQQQIATQVLQIATAEPTGDSDAQINALLQQLSNPNYNKASVKAGLTKLTPKTGSFA